MALVVVFVGGVATLGIAAVFGGAFFACCGGLMVFVALDQGFGTNATVEVTGHKWERTIEVEEYVRYSDDDWCDQIPANADVTRRKSKFHHRDKRIGRDKDIYEDYCHYDAYKWKVTDHEKKSGKSTSPPPSWPKVKDDRCKREGCQKPGDRKETLEVVFEKEKGHKGDPWDCRMDDESEWKSWDKGDRATLLIGGITGAPYCTELKRKSGSSKPKPTPKPSPSPKPKKRKKRRR